MANITRIKAGDSKKSSNSETKISDDKKLKKVDKSKNKILKSKIKSEKKSNKRPMPKVLKILTFPFSLIFKPFIALGSYIKHSWAELRQVRWPNRKATWSMVLSILIYTAIFITFIVLLDALFTYLFNNFLK